jgi:hypothetical protein
MAMQSKAWYNSRVTTRERSTSVYWRCGHSAGHLSCFTITRVKHAFQICQNSRIWAPFTLLFEIIFFNGLSINHTDDHFAKIKLQKNWIENKKVQIWEFCLSVAFIPKIARDRRNISTDYLQKSHHQKIFQLKTLILMQLVM